MHTKSQIFCISWCWWWHCIMCAKQLYFICLLLVCCLVPLKNSGTSPKRITALNWLISYDLIVPALLTNLRHLRLLSPVSLHRQILFCHTHEKRLWRKWSYTFFSLMLFLWMGRKGCRILEQWRCIFKSRWSQWSGATFSAKRHIMCF